MTIHICSPYIDAACGYEYPDCPKKVYLSDGMYMPCPTLTDWLEIEGEQSDDALSAMAYEVGISFKKMKKYYLAAMKKADKNNFGKEVQRN